MIVTKQPSFFALLLTTVAISADISECFTMRSHRSESTWTTTTNNNNNIMRVPSRLFYEPFESESIEDRERRMEMVRAIQRTFYADETGTSPPQFGVYQNMPIWRDDYTELPGFQRVMTVTEPDFVNMLLKIVSSKEKPWYFGHLFIPGGSKNINHPHYRLELGSDSAMTGTLMQVSDYKINKEDGSIVVVVQALGRFLVVDSVRHGSPYGLATIELLPDAEMIQAHYEEAERVAANFDFALNEDTQGAACAGAVAEAAEWHSYEFQPVSLGNTKQTTSSSSSSGPKSTTSTAPTTPTNESVPSSMEMSSSSPSSNTLTIPPVANLNTANAPVEGSENSSRAVHAAMEEYLSQPPSTMHHGECSLVDYDYESNQKESLMETTMELERNVWIELDTFVRLIRRIDASLNTKMPIPPQLLGLLPTTADLSSRPWPKSFSLDKYTRKMNKVYSLLGKSNPKVSKNTNNQQMSVADGYPTLRRSRRLSYIIWALLDTLDEYQPFEDEEQEGNARDPSSSTTTTITKQDILEMESTAERLEAAIQKVRGINSTLRQAQEL